MRARRPRTALTVAGSDSGGGAGIQADLATFAALGVYGTSAVTALTAQDTRGVAAVEAVAPGFVARQIEVVLGDIGCDAAKTGMLWSGATVTAVARALGAARVRNLVVDPVIAASDGSRLLDDAGVSRLRDDLLPLARVVTPNAGEAARLSGVEVVDLASAEDAARRIVRLGARAVVVTGGHLAGDPVDVLFDGRSVRRFGGARIGGGAHGTGCVFSAALAAALAAGAGLAEAVERARRFVRRGLRAPLAPGAGLTVPIGRRRT